MSEVIIIGAGFGSLASAALLAEAGYQVTILEKNNQVGGRAAQLKQDGFTFDMGPSWYLMPDVFDRFFAELGEKVSDFLELTRLDPQYQVWFADGSRHRITPDIATTRQLFEQLEPGSGSRFDRYMRQSQLKYELAMKHFLYRNIDSLSDLMTTDTLKYGWRLNLLQSMDQHLRHSFSSERIRNILTYTLVFLGGSPYNTPALFSLMSHMDFNLGVYYPTGGFHQVAKVMAQLATDRGVTIKLNQPVTQLETTGNAITTVHTASDSYQPKIVLANGSYPHIESLLDTPNLRTYSEKYWQNRTLAPSAFLLYLGVKGTIPELTHHTIYFSQDTKRHYREIFDQPAWPKQPSFYINKPTATEKAMAPKGHENLMILVPVAAGLPESDTHRATYSEYIINYVEKSLGISLQDRIVTSKIFSGVDFTHTYNSFQGNALGGLANTLFQSVLWRPKNHSPKVSNLFFAGANTVPGIGVPPAIISGQLAVDKIKQLFPIK